MKNVFIIIAMLGLAACGGSVKDIDNPSLSNPEARSAEIPADSSLMHDSSMYDTTNNMQ